MGCGTVMAFLLVLVALVLVGSNEAIGYYFSHCRDMDLLECLMSGIDEPEPEEGAVVATGSYEHKGYTVIVNMNVPLGGGAVTGTVSGECDGKITGTYDGKQGGTVSGDMSGVCSPFFVNVPAGAAFSGTVNKTGKTVQYGFNGESAGFSHQGSMTLSYP